MPTSLMNLLRTWRSFFPNALSSSGVDSGRYGGNPFKKLTALRMANLIGISCRRQCLRLPGDEIIHRDKRLNVNGPPVPTEQRPDYQSMQSMDGRNAVRLERFIESLGEYPHAI